MTTYLRQYIDGKCDSQIEIDGASWDLDVQLQIALQWLQSNATTHLAEGEQVLDIGYYPRHHVAVAGYTIAVELMAILVKNNITLWLSDYLNTTKIDETDED